MNTHGVVNNCFPSKYVSRAFKYFLLSLMVQACCEETVKVTMEMRGEPSTACRKESVESSSYGQSKGEQKGLWFFLLPWITSSCLIILLRSLISYISPSGFLCFSDSICQAMRYEVKWQPELKESPEEVENQVKKKKHMRNRWIRKSWARQKFSGKSSNSSTYTARRSGIGFLMKRG